MTTVRTVEQPEWLNESFFEDIYRDRVLVDVGQEEARFKLKIVACTGVVDIGDNYASTMYRVKVNHELASGSNETSSFIVKAIIHDNEMMKDFSVFPTEFEAYRTAVQGFTELWHEVGESVQFGPRCLKIVEDDNEIIVLSDLKEEGCRMANRFEGVNLDHAKITLKKLAKWHAASLKYKEKVGAFGPRLSRDYFEPKMDSMMDQFTQSKVKALANAVEAWGIGQQYVEKIKAWQVGLIPEIKRIFNPNKESGAEFLVLCHGDLWLNNQLFKYDNDDNVTDVIFVDYQITYWGRPVTDLLYFLFSSVQPEQLVAQFDALIKYYHDNLVESAAKLGVATKIPLLRDLLADIMKNGFFTAICCIGIIPIVLTEKSDDSKVENFFNNEDNNEAATRFEEKMFSGNRRLENKMRLLLPFFDNKGLLDVDCVPAKAENSEQRPEANGHTGNDSK